MTKLGEIEDLNFCLCTRIRLLRCDAVAGVPPGLRWRGSGPSRSAGRWARGSSRIRGADGRLEEAGRAIGSHGIRLRWLVPTGIGGGDEETRTPDPLLAKEMLYRLSYVPTPETTVVGVSGLEPETSALSGQCSNQLS